MATLTQLPLLDELLQKHAPQLGGDMAAYRNHCYRLVNFAHALATGDADQQDKLSIAAAFHDLGIWTHGTFDYLPPSEQLAREWLPSVSRADWADEIAAMITQHHKITPCAPRQTALVEAFRQADWVDVSAGVLRHGLPRAFIRDIQSAFPDAGFHLRLLKLSARRLRTHPLSPLPMMRW
jgi:hypothetical protein